MPSPKSLLSARIDPALYGRVEQYAVRRSESEHRRVTVTEVTVEALSALLSQEDSKQRQSRNRP